MTIRPRVYEQLHSSRCYCYVVLNRLWGNWDRTLAELLKGTVEFLSAVTKCSYDLVTPAAAESQLFIKSAEA